MLAPTTQLNIVVLSWNHRTVTARCLDAIRESTRSPYHLIVADNGSTDGAREWLAQKCRDVTLVLNPENQGFARGINQGIAMGRAPYVTLVNNDVLVCDGWDAPLVQALEADDMLGVVTPLTDAPAQRICKWRFQDQHGIVYDPLMVPFTCVMLRRETVQHIGPLDERFYPIYGEDDDYCLRLRKAGYKLGICTDVTVHHAHSTTTSAAGQDVYRQRARVMLAEKWGAAWDG